jgi:SAM-dependent methyltransferase
MADEIDLLEVGKRADIILVDKTDPTLTPAFGDDGSLSNLIYSFHGTVDTTIVDGKRILDAGCGTGVYSEWLLERGADVVGFDVSEAMLNQVPDAVHAEATFDQADLAEPFEFADADTFDGIVSALALGYVADPRDPFAEFARVLKPGGFVVFSTAHPLDQFPIDEDDGEANYYEIEKREKDWDVDVPYYRRPVGEIITPLLEAGFQIEQFVEPQPTAAFEEKWPERYEKESRYPVFLCVRAELPRTDQTG